MKRLWKYLLQGLLYTAPIGITAFIIYQLITFTDNLLKDTLYELIGINIPGLGLLIIFVLLILIGIAGQSILIRPLKSFITRLMDRAPLLKLIYSALNDLFSAFVGKEKKFSKPVMVLVNSISNLEKMGFLTEEDLEVLGTKDKVAVYFPHSYNFSGELFIVPRENIRALDINPAEAMKFIVSAGVSGFEEKVDQQE